LVLFDRTKWQDEATYKIRIIATAPYVLVNGIVVIKNGEHTGPRRGKRYAKINESNPFS